MLDANSKYKNENNIYNFDFNSYFGHLLPEV
jgi:hypothetical protein